MKQSILTIRHIQKLAFAALAMAMLPAAAGAQSISLKIDRGDYTLDYTGTPRREVFETLFTALGATVEWRDEALANEVIGDTVRGPLEGIALHLLKDINHAITYAKAGQAAGLENPMERVIIYGVAREQNPDMTIEITRVPLKRSGAN